MGNLFILAIAVAVFAYGAWVRTTPVIVPEPSVSPTSFPSPSSEPTIMPTSSGVPLATLMPSIFLVYPGARQITQDGKTTKYEVVGSASDVFSWYQSVFKDNGFHVGVSVQTRSNEKFKGVLNASKNGEKLEVKIDQEESGKPVMVELKRS